MKNNINNVTNSIKCTEFWQKAVLMNINQTSLVSITLQIARIEIANWK